MAPSTLVNSRNIFNGRCIRYLSLCSLARFSLPLPSNHPSQSTLPNLRNAIHHLTSIAQLPPKEYHTNHPLVGVQYYVSHPHLDLIHPGTPAVMTVLLCSNALCGKALNPSQCTTIDLFENEKKKERRLALVCECDVCRTQFHFLCGQLAGEPVQGCKACSYEIVKAKRKEEAIKLLLEGA